MFTILIDNFLIRESSSFVIIFGLLNKICLYGDVKMFACDVKRLKMNLCSIRIVRVCFDS